MGIVGSGAKLQDLYGPSWRPFIFSIHLLVVPCYRDVHRNHSSPIYSVCEPSGPAVLVVADILRPYLSYSTLPTPTKANVNRFDTQSPHYSCAYHV